MTVTKSQLQKLSKPETPSADKITQRILKAERLCCALCGIRHVEIPTWQQLLWKQSWSVFNRLSMSCYRISRWLPILQEIQRAHVLESR
jgi:hypothetical protein